MDKGINVIVDHLEPIEGPVIHDRHLNGANILWIDGHVKFFPSAYSMLMSEKTFFDRD